MYDPNDKDDMMEELFGAAFVGGYGGALLEADDLDDEEDDDEQDSRFGVDRDKK